MKLEHRRNYFTAKAAIDLVNRKHHPLQEEMLTETAINRYTSKVRSTRPLIFRAKQILESRQMSILQCEVPYLLMVNRMEDEPYPYELIYKQIQERRH